MKTTLRTTMSTVLMMVLALAAFASGGAEEGGAEGSQAAMQDEEMILIAAQGSEPDQLDPHMTSAYASFQVLENVYDTLVQPAADLSMEPALAESWEISDDNLTWTFTMRDGVTFHNGRELVADDVVYSFERIIAEVSTGGDSAPWRASRLPTIRRS